MPIAAVLQLVGDVGGVRGRPGRSGPDLQVHQRQQRVGAVARGWPRGRRSALSPPAGSEQPARGATDVGRAAAPRSTGASSRLSQAPIGVPKPRFLRSQDVGRQQVAERRLHHVLQPAAANLDRRPASRAASSTSSWSSSGTRHSSDTAMLILSVSISRSSGSWVSASTASIRFSSSSLPASAKAACQRDRPLPAPTSTAAAPSRSSRHHLQVAAVALVGAAARRSRRKPLARRIAFSSRGVAVGRQRAPRPRRRGLRPSPAAGRSAARSGRRGSAGSRRTARRRRRRTGSP